MFDTPGGKAKMIKQGRIQRTIHFLVPQKKNFDTKPHVYTPRVDRKENTFQVPRTSKGRAFVAGLIASDLIPSTK